MEQITLTGIIVQIINFLVLVGILTYLLYKPVKRILNERRKKIESTLKEIEIEREKLEKERKEAERNLQEIYKKAEEIIKKAELDAEAERTKIIREARRESQQIIENARKEGEELKKRFILELKDEIVSLAITIASNILGESVKPKLQERMLNEFVNLVKSEHSK
ncbi:F0F1 ATP synthase subunit B [bacterium]|nr:F0F1 ATP synthase subunit B [bacterium]